MPIAAAAISGGLSFASGIAGKRSADKDFRLSRERGQKSIDRFQRPLDALYFGQQEDFLRKAMGAQTGAYEDALANLSAVGRSSKREALNQSRSSLSQGLQGLAGSGLGSSTLAQNYRTGAASRLSQDLAGIDQNLAGLRSNLLIGKGGAQAQGFGSLADLYGQRRQREADLEALRYQLFTPSAGGPAPVQSVDLGGIAQFASLFK